MLKLLASAEPFPVQLRIDRPEYNMKPLTNALLKYILRQENRLWKIAAANYLTGCYILTRS